MTGTQHHKLQENASQDSTWSSAPKLSSKIRDLAYRSHCTLQAWTLSQESRDVIGDDLRDLRDQVARLQHKIHARKLDSLIPWVDALKRQVDNRIADAGKVEK
jgi:hypothetical protein